MSVVISIVYKGEREMCPPVNIPVDLLDYCYVYIRSNGILYRL